MKMVLVFLISALAFIWQTSLSAAPDPGYTCQGNTIRKTFPSGALWKICWTIKDKEGLSLSQIHFKAPGGYYRRVLGEASLSQVQTNFNDGNTASIFITTQIGMGGDRTQTITRKTCKGGKLYAENGRNVMCARTLPKGYLYKHKTQRQASAFELSSYSQIGTRNYQLRWMFHENGIIEPAIGLKPYSQKPAKYSSPYGRSDGQNSKTNTNFTDHYLWRLDFDIGDTHADDSVREVSSKPSQDRRKKYKTVDTLQTEVAKRLSPENKTFWNIFDGSIAHPGIGPVSYDIMPSSYDQSGANNSNQSWLDHDVYFTRYNRCERHMANNKVGCGDNVTDFIRNNQAITQTDIVIWYKQSNHYQSSSEDTNKTAPRRWTSFQLIPRDWNAKNPY